MNENIRLGLSRPKQKGTQEQRMRKLARKLYKSAKVKKNQDSIEALQQTQSPLTEEEFYSLSHGGENLLEMTSDEIYASGTHVEQYLIDAVYKTDFAEEIIREAYMFKGAGEYVEGIPFEEMVGRFPTQDETVHMLGYAAATAREMFADYSDAGFPITVYRGENIADDQRVILVTTDPEEAAAFRDRGGEASASLRTVTEFEIVESDIRFWAPTFPNPSPSDTNDELSSKRMLIVRDVASGEVVTEKLESKSKRSQPISSRRELAAKRRAEQRKKRSRDV